MKITAPAQQDKKLRIGEMARLAGVTVRTIRYYEQLGLLGSSRRNLSEHRRYSRKDLLYLRRIQQLKGYGLSLREIGEIVDLAAQDPSGEKRRLMLLSRYQEKRRQALARREQLEAYLRELDWHIEQLRRVRNFQACPGQECAACEFRPVCRLAETANEEHRYGESP
jgi:DNA-binding transcriptional MerR regulator